MKSDLSGDVFHLSAIRLKDAFRCEINIARLDLNQQHISRLVNDHDIDLAMLFL